LQHSALLFLSFRNKTTKKCLAFGTFLEALTTKKIAIFVILPEEQVNIDKSMKRKSNKNSFTGCAKAYIRSLQEEGRYSTAHVYKNAILIYT